MSDINLESSSVSASPSPSAPAFEEPVLEKVFPAKPAVKVFPAKRAEKKSAEEVRLAELNGIKDKSPKETVVFDTLNTLIEKSRLLQEAIDAPPPETVVVQAARERWVSAKQSYDDAEVALRA